MNLSQINLTDLTNLALENEVDIEVWHGVTTSKDRTVRRHMRLTPAGCPTVLITFGDRKNGELGSVIHIEGHKKLRVRFQDVYSQILVNRSNNQWRTTPGEAEQPNLSALYANPQHPYRVSISGNKLEHAADGVSNHYTLTARNVVVTRDGGTGHLFDTDPTVVDLWLPEHDPQPFLGTDRTRWSEAALQAALQADARWRQGCSYQYAPRDMRTFDEGHDGAFHFEGTYVYPNRIIDLVNLEYIV